ncbi:MAG: BamA/OMP85 family outer membrane protein [Gemmatimonas sp.]
MRIRSILQFAGLLLGASFAPAGAQETRTAQRPEPPAVDDSRPEVRELRILGVKSFKKGDVQKALSTQESSCKNLPAQIGCVFGARGEFFFEHRYLDREEFKRDVIRLLVFYFRRGYRETTVDTSITNLGGNKVRITMAVTEGPPIVTQRVTVEGIGNSLTPRDTVRDTRPDSGQPFNLLALDSSVTRLRDKIWERGYVDAEAKLTTNVSDSARTATADIAIDPKRRVTIGEIRIEGQDRINEQTIRNSLLIEPGDIFRPSRISSSQRALYESALFRKAVIDTAPRNPSAPDSVRGLVVQVIEGPQREARTSFGFTTADFFQAEGSFTHHYLADQPLRLNATVTIGNLLAQQLTRSDVFVDISDIVKDNDLGRYYAPTYLANVDLTRRWFGSPRNTVGLGVFSQRRSLPGVLVDNSYGANATFTRLVANRTPLSFRYQFEQSRVDAGDVYFCVNYGVCDNATIDALRGAQKLSPLSATISTDRTDIPFSPTRGFLARAEVEHASAFTASDFRYNRAMIEASAYRKIGFRGSVVAAHVKAGWVAPLKSTASAVGDSEDDLGILHPRKRFYAGGSQSVRGFGENQLGPRVLTVSAQALDTATIIRPDSSRVQCSSIAPTAECIAALRDSDIQTRPLGGTTLLEGGIEVRIPITGSIVGALFVDAAVLGNPSVETNASAKAAITPGFGFRYKSPVGPIRVDLGLRPTLKSPLAVITEVRGSDGKLRLVDLTNGAGCNSAADVGCRLYPGPISKQSFLNRITNRLTLHLSIGEAY